MAARSRQNPKIVRRVPCAWEHNDLGSQARRSRTTGEKVMTNGQRGRADWDPIRPGDGTEVTGRLMANVQSVLRHRAFGRALTDAACRGPGSVAVLPIGERR